MKSYFLIADHRPQGVQNAGQEFDAARGRVHRA